MGTCIHMHTYDMHMYSACTHAYTCTHACTTRVVHVHTTLTLEYSRRSAICIESATTTSQLHACMCMYMRMCMRMRAHTHSRECMHVCVHVCMHVHACVCTCMHACACMSLVLVDVASIVDILDSGITSGPAPAATCVCTARRP